MTHQKMLILGGKGKTGRKVVQGLQKLGYSPRIGSRSATPAFDWEEPETWKAALAEMDRVYVTFQPDLAVPGAPQAITAFSKLAKDMGLNKIVLLSGRGEKEAQRCEQIVMDSGLDWTIVRADWFNQNFSESFFLDPLLAGHMAMPRADVKIAFVDTDDIAEVAVAALTDDSHSGKVYELTGPRLISFPEVVKEIAAATGREIQFQSLSLEAYIDMLQSFQVPDDYVWLVEYLFTHVLDGRNSYIAEGVEEALGRKAKDFSVYVKETAATGVWNP